MNKKNLWYPAAMVIALSVAFSPAQAKALEQIGAGATQATLLKTYGVDVPSKAGLKTLLPAGWNLFIYKNTGLPQSISWTVGDTWIGALEKFANKNELAVRLDWSKKAVYVSSPEVALEAREALAEIDNAARTPLPAYALARPATQPAVAVSATPQKVVPTALAQTTDNQGPVAAAHIPSDLLARALAATAPKAPLAVPNTAAATTPFVAMPSVAAVAPSLKAPLAEAPAHETPIVSLASPLHNLTPAEPLSSSRAPWASSQANQVSQSDAFVHGNLEDIVRMTAAKLGYQVSWETITLPLNGPVTFLGVDAAEDMLLLQKALGLRQSPIAIDVYRASNVIRVTARGMGKEPLTVYDTTYSGLIGYGPKTGAAPHSALPELRVPNQGALAAAPRVMAPPPVMAAVPIVRVAPAVSAALIAPETPAPASVPVPVTITLNVAKGESLSKAITQFLKTQGWELQWRVPNDMEAEFPFKASGTSIAQVLKALLPKLGLDTDMYEPSKMVVVHPIENLTE